MYIYFRVCMRICVRASFYQFTRAVVYLCVMCVYVHAHARGSGHMYVAHVQHVYTTEDATSRRCACTRVNSRCTRLLVYGIRMRVFARLHAHVCFRSCSVLLYIPPINRLVTPCNLRVRMRISVFIACCFFSLFSEYAGLQAC